MKSKLCKNCQQLYTPSKMGQKVCCGACAIAFAVSERGKAEKVAQVKERKADAVKREKLKRRADWIADVQTVFNKFIRLRDQHAGHVCISSGKPLDWTGNAVDAGHYRSRGSAPHLRFDECNCHAQSKQENRYASGNVTGYRIGLIQRIGIDAVEALEADQEHRMYSIDDLKALKLVYQAKVKYMEKVMA